MSALTKKVEEAKRVATELTDIESWSLVSAKMISGGGHGDSCVVQLKGKDAESTEVTVLVGHNSIDEVKVNE